MKFLVIIVFLAAVFIHEHECAIKVLEVVPRFVNLKWSNENNFQVSIDLYNETSNYELLHWDIPENLPKDILLQTKAYATTSSGEKGKLVLDISIPICEPSPDRLALPALLVVPEKELGGECIRKGNYYTTDGGELNIELLIPNIAKYGQIFELENLITSPSCGSIHSWWSRVKCLPNSLPEARS